ncbi:sugar ABC transporter [Paraburkholderia edwinii]|uniref:Sugar ABC transporter n=1 Tax=Paraburkholderia edwinii TaxID=2861782 RepID=A0ABX8URD3_9BURK|nr:sugar ABC transporter [Paraburkholderia edwinii]
MQDAVAPGQASSGNRAANSAAPNVAFFDGAQPPINLLQAFDAVVIDPASGFDPAGYPLAHTVWIARTHAASGDPSSFISQQIEPLWQRGYRGFLLDTPTAIAAIDAIRAAHADARLIVGGDDALAAALPHAAALYAVVGPSLVRGAAPGAGMRTLDVPADERAARSAAALSFTQRTGVPVISVELCPGDDRACARATAAQVVASGVTPYVTNVSRNVVGIGAIEVLPRRVLVVQDRPDDLPLDETPGVRDVATPLNYLGYDVEYANVNDGLPDDVTPDRYAGVVVWLEGDEARDAAAWRRWVDARIASHVPVAFIGQFGFDAAEDEGPALDLQPVAGPFTEPVSVVSRDPIIGFETDPKVGPRDLTGVRVGAASHSLLRVKSGEATLDPVAITPWGGYALSPYTVVSLNGIGQERWAIQPIRFFSDALRLTPMPAPSVTTENGRRLFMTHVDGDGFASRAEFPGADYSGEALYEQIFTRYKVPMTLSVIEGEVGPKGLYPQISPRLEEIARKMFALPYVEIGTHTYSHPFEWENVDAKTGERIDRGGGDTAFSLNIPNYKFNIDREITGSIDYINSRLAPPGKKTVVLQWPGNCEPPAIVVRKVYAAGVDNVNGGDTVITKSANSWTNIAPIGVAKGPGAYQVYAPNQDENVYTNDWLGPFYGFTRVLETFDMTDRPLRFKPIDIYYHMYSGTKIASLRALDQIFAAVLKQPVLPVKITDYTHKVLDWRTFAVAREVRAANQENAADNTAALAGSTWIVRGNGEVRELHWPGANAPDLRASRGVTGYAAGPDGTYIHIADGAARVAFDTPLRDAIAAQPTAASATATVAATRSPTQAASSNTMPYISQANGFVRDFKRDGRGMTFAFGGYYQPFVELANAQRCSVSVAGRPVAAKRDGTKLRFDTAPAAGLNVDYQPVEVSCNG